MKTQSDREHLFHKIYIGFIVAALLAIGGKCAGEKLLATAPSVIQDRFGRFEIAQGRLWAASGELLSATGGIVTAPFATPMPTPSLSLVVYSAPAIYGYSARPIYMGQATTFCPRTDINGAQVNSGNSSSNQEAKKGGAAVCSCPPATGAGAEDRPSSAP